MPPDTSVGDSFVELLETCRRFLLTLANAELPARLRAKGGASDLVQEALSTAYTARHQFRGQTVAELRAWVRAILRNELAMFRRHYQSTEGRDVSREVPIGTQVVATATTPIAQLIRTERQQRLTHAVAQLPEEFRLVVVLRIEHGLTFAALGEHLGRTEEAARKLFTRALLLLREQTSETAE